MKINWGRILNAGLVAEILLILIYQFIVQLYGRGMVAAVFVIAGCFVFMLVGALWVGRKIESRYILHGFLVGIVAVIYYVVRTLPDVVSGQYVENYWLSALAGHTPKILGGMLGGYLAGRQKKMHVFSN